MKLRLRGKGSGFKEGTSMTESEERLNLCVSAKDDATYKAICVEVEELLFKITKDFQEFALKLHKKAQEGIAYKKLELKKNKYQEVKQVTLEQMGPVFEFIMPASVKRISVVEIEEILSMREKARKQGRFRDADDMRN